MPRPPLPDDVVEFLRRPNPAVIASSRPDGQPVSVATWYALDDDRRLFVIWTTRASGSSTYAPTRG